MNCALAFVPFVEQVLSVTFEPGQRIFWGVAADGWQPGDLEGDDRAMARAMFGDIDEIPTEARREVAAIKGAGIGFSFFLGLRLLHRAVTATELGAPGEIRPSLAVAPDLRLGRIPIRNALGAADGVPEIKRMIESRGADGFVLRREGGRLTSVECLPASVGGRALRGRRYLEVGFDESGFFRDGNYEINDIDCKRAVISRCLGAFWNGSTPWLETSDVWKTFEHNFGNPTTALAARIPTLLVRTDQRMIDLVNAETERDPEGADTEYRCKPPAGSGGYFFDGFAIGECATPGLPVEIPHDSKLKSVVAFDPAFARDACAGVVVRKNGETFEVCEVFERKPKRHEPLVPSETVRAFGDVALKHGARMCASDVHYKESVREHLPEALTFVDAPSGNQGKATVFGCARELIHSGRVKWSAGHKRLAQQMREVIAKPLSGGLVAIRSPRRKGAHGDLASALCLALWLADDGAADDHQAIIVRYHANSLPLVTRTGFAKFSREYS